MGAIYRTSPEDNRGSANDFANRRPITSNKAIFFDISYKLHFLICFSVFTTENNGIHTLAMEHNDCVSKANVFIFWTSWGRYLPFARIIVSGHSRLRRTAAWWTRKQFWRLSVGFVAYSCHHRRQHRCSCHGWATEVRISFCLFVCLWDFLLYLIFPSHRGHGHEVPDRRCRDVTAWAGPLHSVSEAGNLYSGLVPVWIKHWRLNFGLDQLRQKILTNRCSVQLRVRFDTAFNDI